MPTAIGLYLRSFPDSQFMNLFKDELFKNCGSRFIRHPWTKQMDTETGAIADRSAFKKQMTGLTFLTGEEKSTAELLMDDCLERSQSVEIDIKGLRAYQALHCVHPSIVKALKQKVLLDLHVS